MPKDNFSSQSKAYATFRPSLPDDVYRFILQQVQAFDLAWDVGTGNGQTAVKLADHFTKVFATDISENQLANATQRPNIVYKKEPAEASSLESGSVDLVTIAQAIHWFDFDNFYKEVRRVAKPGGIIAAFTYSLLQVENRQVNDLIDHFYWNDTHAYWDEERKYVDDGYRTIPFPFKEIEAPAFGMHYEWNSGQLLGYLNTWSASLHYHKKTGRTLTQDFLEDKLSAVIAPGETIKITFPIHMRIGVV